MRTIPTALLAALLLVAGCQFVTPPPEVRVTSVDPSTYEVTQNSGGEVFYPAATLEITNNVEAVVTGFSVGYFDATGKNPWGAKTTVIPMHAEFDSAITLNSLPVEISSEMIGHMYGAGGGNALVRLYFSGEDAYGYDLEFDADMDIGIYDPDL